MSTLELLQAAVKEQADHLFPHRTDHHMFLKMYEEIGEVIAADEPDKIGSEIADIMIMLLDYAARNGVTDLTDKIVGKMIRNGRAQWKETNGVYKRVK